MKSRSRDDLAARGLLSFYDQNLGHIVQLIAYILIVWNWVLGSICCLCTQEVHTGCSSFLKVTVATADTPNVCAAYFLFFC